MVGVRLAGAALGGSGPRRLVARRHALAFGGLIEVDALEFGVAAGGGELPFLLRAAAVVAADGGVHG